MDLSWVGFLKDQICRQNASIELLQKLIGQLMEEKTGAIGAASLGKATPPQPLGSLEAVGGVAAYIEKSTRAAWLESEVAYKQREIDRLEKECAQLAAKLGQNKVP